MLHSMIGISFLFLAYHIIVKGVAKEEEEAYQG